MTAVQLSTVGRSLRNRNFQTYLVGQGISHAGMWIQMTAELWLIVELTDSGTALGIHSVLRLGPVLLFGIFGGLIGDRFNRRRTLIVTQSLHTVATTVLAVVVWLTVPTLALIYFIVLVQGIVNAVDNPIRRSFIRDLTDDAEISNAVSLHNAVSTIARALGPAIGGVLITTVGLEWCFAINALSFLAVLLSLLVIDRSRLRPHVAMASIKGQTLAGVRYAWSHPRIRGTLIFSFIAAVFAWQWNVILPVYARSEFGGDARLFGFFVFALSAGSVAGALHSARLPRMGGRHLRLAGAGMSLAFLCGAVATSLPMAFVALALWGAATSAFNIGAQSRLQLAVDDAMAACVMSLYSVGFTGSKPIGALLVGVTLDATNSRVALAVGAVAVGLATMTYALTSARRPSLPAVPVARAKARAPSSHNE